MKIIKATLSFIIDKQNVKDETKKKEKEETNLAMKPKNQATKKTHKDLNK